MRSIPLLLVALAFFAAPAGAQQGQAGGRIIVSEDADYFGFDYRTVKEVDLDGCKRACLADSACRAFTYNIRAQWCFLKDGHGELRATPGAVAGRVVPAGEATAATKPMPLGFLPETMADDARALARDIARERPADGADPATLRERARAAGVSGDARAAAAAWRTALSAAPDDAAAWTGLAAALLATAPADYSERYQLPARAGLAALNAYRQAATTGARADALFLLAAAFERQQVYRPALEAYKAGLTLKDSSAARAAFTRLRAAQGFRILDYSVDAEAASPRICVQFSESLPPGRIDYSDFVTLDGQAAPAVEAEDRQVCVSGIRHGQRYAVGLRAGLPSTVGEVLEAPAVLNVYVRDRAPAVRFAGRSFVLPRAGPHGIPLVIVNTPTVEIDLYRIGDRALAQAIVQDRFLGQLDRYSADEIADTLGQRVWRGTLDVQPVINEDVTQSFPVDEALPTREPGVYVMVARPHGGNSQDWQARATQWFIVSDIGLAALSGADGLHVFARSLASAAPLAGARLALIARNNEVLGAAATDADGHAVFAAGLARGEGGLAPALVTARLDTEDHAFLDLTGPAFDLADRGVGGRPAPQPIDVFAYTERGIYRPGDTVHLVALARDDRAAAVSGLPLTLIFSRPDGVEYRRLVARDAGGGGHAADFVLPAAAMRGTWRVAVHADAGAPALAEIRFLVEDFLPDRVAFELTSEAAVLPRRGTVSATVDGRFLYGAPAAGLRLEGEVTVRPADGLEAWPGYHFGLADEEVQPTRMPLADLPVTDGAGRAGFELAAGAVPPGSGPLEAVATVRMREGGGRAVERTLTLPLAANGAMIGLRPRFGDLRIDEGASAVFDVIALDASGARTAGPGLRWQLLRIDRDYQWYRVNGAWSFEPVDYSSRVADGTLDAPADRPGEIAAPVERGRYRLEVSGAGPGAPATSVEFTAGWYVEAAAADTPDNLPVSLDKAAYRPGETARVTFEAPHAGAALVTVMSDRLVAMRTLDVAPGSVTAELPVSEAWGAGAYVAVSLYRPTGTEGARDPVRAIGLAWVRTDMGTRALRLDIEAPEMTRPRRSLDVPVAIAGLAAGETAHLTLAAVDVGILNVTAFEPPDPEGWYYGQRRLGVDIRDLYGRLIDGARGTPGRVRSGGDISPVELAASPPREEPVVLFSGIVAADARGRATVSLDLPAFNGTLRLMAVAWSASAVGHATRDVIVRDPVVVTASHPRFLAPGDTSRLRLDIDNRDGPAGAYALEVAAGGRLAIEDGRRMLELAEGARMVLDVAMHANGAGDGEIEIRLAGPDGEESLRTIPLAVRPAQPPVSERRVVALAPGESLTVTSDLLADRVAGSGAVALSVSRAGRLDLPSLVAALDRYPYGCAEQLTSRALPLLYLSEVAAQSGLDDDEDVRQRIRKAIDGVLAYQSAAGGFGLWGPGDGDPWLDAYIGDFLTRARERGFAVPDRAFSRLLDRLQNSLAYAGDGEAAAETAYALYVLARNRRAAIGDLRYYADARLADFASPLARAQIAAALALYGEPDRAGAAFRAAAAAVSADGAGELARGDFGSRLRDGAAILALASEAGGAPIPTAPLVELVARDFAAQKATSTQENAWLLLAAHALMNGAPLDLAVNGAPVSGDLVRRLAAALLAAAPATVENRGPEPVDAVLTVTGVPATPLPAGGEGFSIARDYYTLDGTPVDLSAVGQNERFVVVIEAEELNEWPSRLLVVDMLPAGLEIDNPALVDSADIAGLDWLPEKPTPARVEFRDDRFIAALDRSGTEPRGFTLAYVVRAVTPGRYVHPPALIEDMYRPHLAARTATGAVEVVGARP